MPGFDGTGPRGMGPMTGGGRGFCVVPGAATVRRPLGMRRGAGYGYANRVAPVYTQEQEIDSLKNEMQALKEILDRIESQIEKLAER
ncbi:MAG: DUF5320 domain-containing protein [Dehalococcoidales bacterium]|nr:DUF5320 domain-containing protein [Dehalococcoidales bacterium]